MVKKSILIERRHSTSLDKDIYCTIDKSLIKVETALYETRALFHATEKINSDSRYSILGTDLMIISLS